MIFNFHKLLDEKASTSFNGGFLTVLTAYLVLSHFLPSFTCHKRFRLQRFELSAVIYRYFFSVYNYDLFAVLLNFAMSSSPDKAENAIVCTICNRTEPNANKVLECMQCHQCHHFSCKKIVGNAVRKWKEKEYFCSATCKEIQVGRTHPDSPTVMSEVRKVLDAVHNMQEENAKTRNYLEKAINELEKSQEYLCSKFDKMNGDISKLSSNQRVLKKDVDYVHEENVSLKVAVEDLEIEVDRLKRSTIANNAIILGIPALQNEQLGDILNQICCALDHNLPGGAVLELSRLRDPRKEQKYPPIRVVFADVKYKEQLFEKKKSLGTLLTAKLGQSFHGVNTKVIIRDEMTSHGLALLREVRDVQEELKLQFVWPGRDGVVLTRKCQGAKIQKVRKRSDIRNLTQGKSTQLSSFDDTPPRPREKRPLSTSSPNASSIVEPTPKKVM